MYSNLTNNDLEGVFEKSYTLIKQVQNPKDGAYNHADIEPLYANILLAYNHAFDDHTRCKPFFS